MRINPRWGLDDLPLSPAVLPVIPSEARNLLQKAVSHQPLVSHAPPHTRILLADRRSLSACGESPRRAPHPALRDRTVANGRVKGATRR
ncbi:MAG: hypothetical protein KatS3mg059_1161 [Thermomicrobiales bacterium]|nr:MAG: hypothetical protein KatS3mg059_1161 [Thermomicrobiales bacterium]